MIDGDVVAVSVDVGFGVLALGVVAAHDVAHCVEYFARIDRLIDFFWAATSWHVNPIGIWTWEHVA